MDSRYALSHPAPRLIRPALLALPWALGAALLSGCGEEPSVRYPASGLPNTPTPQSTTLAGTVAVGNPLVGATVALACNGYQATQAATTSEQGQWSAEVPTASLPCAAQASGGTVGAGGAANSTAYYSLSGTVAGTQTLNITPLTDLALASAVRTQSALSLPEWFGSAQLASQLQAVLSELSRAILQLNTKLTASGYTLMDAFNPFSQLFAAIASNPYDQLLDAVDHARQQAAQTPTQLRDAYVSGQPLPSPASPSGCTSGDDKLVFTGAPAGFCGFTRATSANTIPGYYQFTNTADANGTTYVKFNLNGTTITSMVIENSKYAYSCGAGSQPACTGITLHTFTGGVYFSVANTTLQPIQGTSSPITVNGTLTHLPSSSGSTCPTGDNRVTFSTNLNGYVCGLDSDVKQNTYDASTGEYHFAGIPIPSPTAAGHSAYANVNLTVSGGVVTKVLVDSNPGDTNYVCGYGIAPNITPCAGITLRTYNGVTDFHFTNVTLKKGIGYTGMPDTLTVNGLLMYMPQTPPTPTPTNMFVTTGCVDESASGYWNKCSGNVSGNFSFNNLKKSGTTCTLTKSGNTVSLTVGTSTMTALFDGEAGDKVHNNLNSITVSNSTNSFIYADFVNGSPTKINYMLPGTTIMSTCM